MEEEAKHEKAPELVDEVPTDSNPSESPSEVKVDENQNSGQPEQHENMQDNQDHHSSQNEEEKKIEEPEVAASFEAVSHEEAHQEEIKEEHPKNNDDAEEINKDSVHDDDKHDQDRVPIDSQSNEVHDEANQAEIDGSKEEDNKDPEPFEQTEVITDYSMDTLYNKKRVPYIEKNNGTLVLTQNSDYKRAIEHYNKALFAIKILLEDQNLNVGEKFAVKVIEEVEIPVSSNLTLCYLKEKDYQNVIKYADRLLEMDDNNVTQLYKK